MEQECKYLVNNEGNVQLHPKTGEPLQNCRTTKSEYVAAMETIERIIKEVTPTTEIASGTVPETADYKNHK